MLYRALKSLPEARKVEFNLLYPPSSSERGQKFSASHLADVVSDN